jgi:hypothetical protein
VTEQQKEYEDIGNLIGQRLRTRAAVEYDVSESDDHLDADTVAAFVEGRIEESGASQITSHLIVCSACRIATAQTMHLECVMADVNIEEPEPVTATGRLRKFLGDLAGRAFAPSDEVVFAYQEPRKEEPATDKSDEDKTPASKSESNPGS